MLRTTPLLLLMTACGISTVEPVTRTIGPSNALPGTCHALGVTPAILETVTEQRLESAEVRNSDGIVVEPARFRTMTSTRIVQERGENWFEIPCALRDGDPAFIAQIQRALAARELYAGDINGMYDPPTRKAVRTFQAARGLESGMLSKTSAQTLGLVELGRNGI